MSAAEWIAKRRELLADATEGPWEWLAYGNGMQLVRRCAHNHNHNILETTDDWPPYTQDAALIADARTSLPRALDALEAALDRARKIVDEHGDRVYQDNAFAVGAHAAAVAILDDLNAALRGEA